MCPGQLLLQDKMSWWETDFTKIYIDNEGWVYLTAYLDLCSWKINGHLYPVCHEQLR